MAPTIYDREDKMMKRTLTMLSFMFVTCMLLISCGGSGSTGAGNNGSNNNTPTSVPGAPTGVQATAGDGQVTISWTVPSGSVDSYTVYYSTTNPVITSSAIKVTGFTSTSNAIIGLTNGTVYYFVVTAVNSYGESPTSAQVFANPGVGPSSPAGVGAASGSGQNIVSWNTASGATSYNVYWSTTAGVTKANGTKISNATSPYTHTGLTNGTTYYYVVTAVNAYAESYDSPQTEVTPAVILATGPANPLLIAVDATHVYWTDDGGGLTVNSGNLRKVAINGGAVTTLSTGLATGISGPYKLVLDASNVYWSEGSSIKKISKSGGAVTTLQSSNGAAGLAVDATNVYFSENLGGGNLYKVGVSGGAVTTLAAGLSHGARSLAVDSTSVYYADYGANGTSCNVGKVALVGGALTGLATGLTQVSGIAIDSTSVYWIKLDSIMNKGVVQKTGLNGGTVTTLATGQGGSYSSTVAVDSANVYWTESNNTTNAIKKVGINGGAVTTLAIMPLSIGQDNGILGLLAVDSSNIYWPAADGTIRKVAK